MALGYGLPPHVIVITWGLLANALQLVIKL